jgi:DNA invertase Pin-like site-specific DNA recombinase
MKAKYLRISTSNQNLERQLLNEKEFDFIYIDICSGGVPFKDRKQAKELFKNKKVTNITINEITRLGRSMSDILQTIQHFTDNGVNILIENLGLTTLLPNGKPNDTASLVINIMSSIGQYERALLKERTRQGIEIAKAKGRYKGRKRGANKDIEKYKATYKKDIEAVKSLLNQGLNISQISKDLDIPRNRIYKFKALNLLTIKTQ